MSTDMVSNEIVAIGAVAGQIWQYLADHGPVTVSRLAKEIDATRDNVMQGLGWLAREDKIRFEETSRGRLVGLV